MRTRAAVAVAAGQPLQVMEVNLDDPKEGEVLIEIKATGICHTDEFTLSGADPEGLFPAIMGHEGAGVVVDTGPGVTSLKKGETWLSACALTSGSWQVVSRDKQDPRLVPSNPSRS